MVIWKRVVFGGLQLIRDIYRVIIGKVRFRPDLIHLNTAGQLAVVRDLTIMLISHWYGIPVVYHIHFGRIPEIAAVCTLEWKLMSKAISKADVVIAIDASTEEAIRNHLPLAKVIRVPNCVNTKVLLETCAASSGQRTLMFLGMIEPTKGIEELIQAWTQLDHLDWKLIIVGPGGGKYKHQLIEKYQPTDMEFSGEMGHDEAMKIMAACDLFVLPSYTEGFPYVIVESMALGKPIIATRVGAIPEMLAEEHGYLIEPQNVRELKSALQCLMSDGMLRNRLGNRARERAINEYSLDAVFERYMSIWKSLAKIK
jgi:glycosyltransferase involved in cell wall biosynthesis